MARFPSDASRNATLSIWTIAGRLKAVRAIGNPQHIAMLRTRKIGETDLISRDGKWFAYATVESPEAALAQPSNGFLGVDMESSTLQPPVLVIEPAAAD